MKNIGLIIQVFATIYLNIGTVIAQQTTKRVLFLGNSYTYGNNLPDMISQLASSAGDTLIYDINAPGGHRLMQHASNPISLQKIAQGNWDYVVIQAQSQEPSWSIPQVESEVLPYAAIISDSIRSANECAIPMFFMTWGRENGDQINCPIVPWVCTYQGMDSALAANYTRMAQENKGIVSPVSKVWNYVKENLGQQLYANDGSHPNLMGSYVAASTFYTSIFKKNPMVCSWNGGINSGVAMLIRDAAKTIVFDSLYSYSYVENRSNALYSSTINYDTVSFNSTGAVYDSLLWNLGDGTYSTADSLTHIYGDSSSYVVELVTYKCGLTDTAKKLIETTLAPPVDTGDTVGINNPFLHSSINIFPIPVLSELNIKTDIEIALISIFDFQGRLIYTKTNHKQPAVIQLNKLQPGVYFVLLTDINNNQFRGSFIKQ